MSKIILILGDQLSPNIASLKYAEKSDEIVMMEVACETDYVQHHKRKIAFLFSAMRHFAISLIKKGFSLTYFKLDDPDNKQNFFLNLQQACQSRNFDEVIVTKPGEYRLLENLFSDLEKLNLPYRILEDDKFFCTKQEFFDFAKSQKKLKLESFYRLMRKRTSYLMKDGKPIGDKWNYDHENRSSYDGKVNIPSRLEFPADDITKEVLTLVEKKFPNRFGSLENFNEAVDREQALKKLDFFIKHCLQYFGKYQDAMAADQAFLFHSRLSHLINCGLLEPREVCEAVIKELGNRPLPAIEGFIRQVIGWREYIRGVYWLNMPEYVNSNYFNHTNSLPDFYWSGECRMNCISQVIDFTKETAYSHHIQRLMITGNLALLMEINPKEVHEWYLAVYDDAYEWVELPNTIGMALFADGGMMSTKPYISSGNYINKMSNFCKGCSYNVKEKTGETACPFNYLYWAFLHKNKDKLADNPRLFMPYRNLAKKSDEELGKIIDSSNKFLKENAILNR